jgi:ribA/ribD-fused uncharacterized protein
MGAKKNVILKFRGKYRFLSNFYPCEVEYEGLVYPSVENAYQAAKTAPFRRKQFTNISPKKAKQLGKKVPMLYRDWNVRRLKVMEELIRKKFTQNEELKQKLLETGDAILVEGNTWNDEFWGVNLKKPDPNSEFGYKGQNWLGKILMKVRDELRKEQEKGSKSATE